MKPLERPALPAFLVLLLLAPPAAHALVTAWLERERVPLDPCATSLPETWTLQVFVETADSGLTFGDGAFGLSLQSTAPGIIEFTDARVNNPVFSESSAQRWSATFVEGLSQDSIDGLLSLAEDSLGLDAAPPNEANADGGSATRFLFAEVKYRIVGNGTASIAIGPLASRPGNWFIEEQLDVSAEVELLGFSTEFQASGLPKDVNRDTLVDSLDIQPFVDLLTSGGYQWEADVNFDGTVDALDIQPFVDIASCSPMSVPEPAGVLLINLALAMLVSTAGRQQARA